MVAQRGPARHRCYCRRPGHRGTRPPSALYDGTAARRCMCDAGDGIAPGAKGTYAAHSGISIAAASTALRHLPIPRRTVRQRPRIGPVRPRFHGRAPGTVLHCRSCTTPFHGREPQARSAASHGVWEWEQCARHRCLRPPDTRRHTVPPNAPYPGASLMRRNLLSRCESGLIIDTHEFSCHKRFVDVT